ncbi:MAG TPA: PA domain-containing protein [Thermoanaerobaculia bacterium]|nr:PA domain-containing protein [Thermoanaerobaculia bacterium]
MKRLLLSSLLVLSATPLLAGTGKFVIINNDPAGVGFNDPTPRTPVGGNPGTTLGQQRMNVLQQAAARWAAALDTNVDIRVRAQFNSLECDATSAVLASANSQTWSESFTNAPRPNVWYPAALANKFAGRDLNTATDDIFIQFNRDLDGPTCFGDRGFYYGLDTKEGDETSMFTTAMHEMAHGLGMSGRGSDFVSNKPSIFDIYTLDRAAGRTWDQLSTQQRQISGTNTSNLVWNGPNVTAKAAQTLERATVFTVTGPANVARNYDIGTASFGAAANRSAIAGTVVAARDAANEEGPTTLDGCTAYENASEVAGRIAIVDRGVCTFVVKAQQAQAAGATALVIVDNRKDTCLPPSMAGNSDVVTIPVISLTQDEGTALRNASSVNAMLRVDPSRFSGASPEGYVRLYAPCTFSGGSSLYHWDTPATPNLLMEPSINSDLIDSLDLSLFQMMDIGWTQPPRTGRRVLHR